jgi:hypothetical protein
VVIMLCSVGVGAFTSPLAVFWSWVCWPVRGLPTRGGWRGGGDLEVALYQGDGGGTFADRGGDAFDRSLAYVTGGEHPGQAGFKRQRRAAGGPVVAGAGWQVRAGEDGPPLVVCDGLAEPLRARL